MKPMRISPVLLGVAVLSAAGVLAVLTSPSGRQESVASQRPLFTKSARSLKNDSSQADGGPDSIPSTSLGRTMAHHENEYSVRAVSGSSPENPKPGGTTFIEDMLPDANSGRSAVIEPPLILNEQSWINTDHNVPGHRLSFQGRQAQVVAFQKVPASNSVALSVTILDDPAESSESRNDTEAGEDIPANQAAGNSVSHAPSTFGGLTYEQQLFRTKWGWAAFDQVQKALRADADESL